VVEYSPHHPVIEGSSPASASARERKCLEKIFIQSYDDLSVRSGSTTLTKRNLFVLMG
jgi:hypothetical protein